ncbi:hypothetical protein J4573_16825 [Actinomadura barringtoniae]|uniref:ORC1/DEAH AAA+ ATPase domain-containing protein n=1 Tax=Actinomadura barringtoniae TaxID=1427535 RepID=A0A939PFI0_9ACTN|nr:AAA family ATPase [Actinomadura barringtoniae]MBO2448769.1 hypothetical protein [Actinomadura barringtoniae]
MVWGLVGCGDRLDAIRRLLAGGAPGPVIITGGPGAGRTSLLRRVCEQVDGEKDAALWVKPAGPDHFSALRPWLPDDFPCHGQFDDLVGIAVAAMTAWAGGRRAVVMVDDAHLADHASLLTLRLLSRSGAAFLLVTRAEMTGPAAGPDPTELLRYERGVKTVRLEPLSLDEVAAVTAEAVGGRLSPATAQALQALTGGNPRSLHDLVVGDRLGERMVRIEGTRRLAEPLAVGTVMTAGDPRRMVAAARAAWRDLALDRAGELCKLAMWHGVGEPLAGVWANLLLLRGRADRGLAFLDSLRPGRIEGSSELALAKAMSLAFGLGRPDAAAAFLRTAATRGPGCPMSRLLAYRAWILASTERTGTATERTGAATERTGAAAEVLQRVGLRDGDREAALFVHGTRAALAFAEHRYGEAVFHYRRALATTDRLRDSVPWMPPYLTARLIDALLMAGRTSEATTATTGFHGGEHSAAWEVAVALSGPSRRREAPAPAPEMARAE